MVFVVKDVIVIFRKIKTIFILIGFKRVFFSHSDGVTVCNISME